MDTTLDLLLQFPLEEPIEALRKEPAPTIEPVPSGPSAHARFVAAAFGGGAAVGAILMGLVDVVPATGRLTDEPSSDAGVAVIVTSVAPVARPTADQERAPSPVSAPSVVRPIALTVTSAPEGAQVTVDGIGWGQTPVTIHHLSSGQKVIRVTKEGYESQQQTISVPNDRPSAAVQVALRARPRTNTR